MSRPLIWRPFSLRSCSPHERDVDWRYGKHPKSITTYRLTDHARLEMARRQINEAEVESVLAAPEQNRVRARRACRLPIRIELGEPSENLPAPGGVVDV